MLSARYLEAIRQKKKQKGILQNATSFWADSFLIYIQKFIYPLTNFHIF